MAGRKPTGKMAVLRYGEQHAGPFRASFRSRTGTGHIARLAGGAFGGFVGWPNFTAVPTDGSTGLPGHSRSVAFRVGEIFRHDGDWLADNWVSINLLHALRRQGQPR